MKGKKNKCIINCGKNSERKRETGLLSGTDHKWDTNAYLGLHQRTQRLMYESQKEEVNCAEPQSKPSPFFKERSEKS